MPPRIDWESQLGRRMRLRDKPNGQFVITPEGSCWLKARHTRASGQAGQVTTITVTAT